MTKKNLAQNTADRIYKNIVAEKKYAPGDRLPGENILSRELGVSRTTLREAIRILASQSVLEVARGKGTFVAADMNTFNEPEVGEDAFVHARLKDLFETRLICEPEAAALACRRASEEEMDAIIDAGKKVETAILNGGDRTGADLEFHNAIVTATHNEFLQRLIPVIHRAVSDAIAMRESEKLSRDTVQDHAMIMDFMKVREPEGAKDAMRIHIHHAIQNLNLRETE